MQNKVDEPTTEGYRDDLIQGVRDARDHKVAALNFSTLLTVKYAEDFDIINEDEIHVKHEDGHSTVYWEGGPYRWTLDVLGGATIGSTEFQSHTNSDIFPEVLTECEGAYVEAKTGYALTFYPA